MRARGDWTGLLAAVLLAGCATVADDAPVATFDEATGESLLHPALPTTLHAERPGLSAIGKDYLALSPVTVSGRGAPVTYLWCSLSSSIDRTITGSPAPAIEAIVLLVDEVPMALRLEPWANAATAMPFDARHGPGIAFAARVTASQLGKIMAAGDLAAYVVETGSHSPRFTVAEDTRTDWADF